jgi:hypothetical protein
MILTSGRGERGTNKYGKRKKEEGFPKGKGEGQVLIALGAAQG